MKIHYDLARWAYTGTVDESCFAKITPDLISDLDDALDYTWATNERAYINSDYTLTSSPTLGSGKKLMSYGKITIPTIRTLTLNSNATLYMNTSKEIDVSGTLRTNTVAA